MIRRHAEAAMACEASAAESDQSVPLKPARVRPLARAICALLVMAMIVLAVRCTMDWRRISAEYEAAEAAEIGAVEADFSRPGRYEIAVADRYPSAHGVMFVLQVRDAGEAAALTDLFTGLSGTIACITPDGERFLEDTLDVERLSMHEKEIILSSLGGGPGEIRVVFEVSSGAPALAGVPQRLMSKNAMCGLEKLPGTIAGFFAIVCAVVGLGLGFVFLRLRNARPLLVGMQREGGEAG